MATINVLVVDDSLVSRGLLTSIFEADPKITVVGAVGSSTDADKLISERAIDVVVLDIEMPGQNGLDYLPSLVRRKVSVIMISSMTTHWADVCAKARSGGAFACLDKADAVRKAEELRNLVKEAAVARHRAAETAGANQGKPHSGAYVALEALIEQHGDGLMNFIAQRIGFATLAGDRDTAARWVSTAGKLSEIRAAHLSQRELRV